MVASGKSFRGTRERQSAMKTDVISSGTQEFFIAAGVRIPAHRVCRGLTPEKAQQRIALLAQTSQPLSPAAGVFPGNDPDIAGQSLAVAKPFRIAQKHIGRQGRDGSHTGMSHQQPCRGSLVCLLQNLLVQLFYLRFESDVHRLQLTATMSRM